MESKEATEEEGTERFTPQHPLPEEIRKMDRDDTVCRYCGVSYLIHSEIKALEKKLKAAEKELEHHQGCEGREKALKQEIQKLHDERGEFEMLITVKDASISTLTTNLKNQESSLERLTSMNNDNLQNLNIVQKSNKELKERNNLLERALPQFKIAAQQQKLGLQDIHRFMEKRDAQMREEIAIILSNVQTTCNKEMTEKAELQTLVSELQDKWGNTSAETENMKHQLSQQEKQIGQLDKLYTENKQLQHQCATLETAKAGLKKELTEAIEKCRGLEMQMQQFKEQFKNKNNEIEEMSNVQRRKDMAMEMTTQKLKTDLKQRETDLLCAKRDLKDLQNRFEQHQQMEADLSRKTSKTLNETKDLKESFSRAKEEIDNLKEEREAMITSHQNRIEQLRESFKSKLAEADNWQEKLEAAIQKEKARHARELAALENRLKDSFVMELEIEKTKYRELMKKYQSGSQENEEKLRAQLASIESRYKAEIADLNEMLAQNRHKSREIEEELRKEIASLKAIIKDLEARLGRLDVGNDELVVKLKTQLRETHQELEDTRTVLDKQTKAGEHFQEQVKHLQETVQKECEERFELTEALSTVKEELLMLKKPAGGFKSLTPRQPTNLSLPSEDPPPVPQTQISARRSISEPSPPAINNQPILTKPTTYGGGVKREYTLTNSSNMVFMGDNANESRPVGGANKRTNGPGTLAQNRRRIAAILGRK